MNDIEYFEQHLDLLIGILEVSEKTVYTEIQYNTRFEYGLTLGDGYESEYINYQNTICTSAFILGFTHFEAYITKVTKLLLTKKPELNKIKFTISVKEILDMDTTFVSELAKKQAHKLQISEKLTLLQKNLPTVNKELFTEIDKLRKQRNCIIHGNGFADDELATLLDYNKGDKILLTAKEVSEYGLKARELAKEIWVEVNSI